MPLYLVYIQPNLKSHPPHQNFLDPPLSTTSKVFEKLLYVRLEKFLSRNNLITKHQFGFRQGYSTEMAVADLCSMSQRNNDDGYFTCCIFLDLSKAFDSVNHNILVNKLEKYGIRSNMYQLLCSYLNNRKQYTECNNAKSYLKTVLCGVPQGSTLGPLLFSLYINDLPLHTKFHVHLFADDTVIMMKDKNISNLQIAVNQELCDVDNWMRYNRLSSHLLKSYFISTIKDKTNPSINFCINVGGHAIPCLESAQYLGVIIDMQLTWSNHVNFMINKLAKAARILSKVRHFVSKVILVKLYHSFVEPTLISNTV